MSIPQIPNKIVYVSDNFVIRLRQLLVFAGMFATVIIQHEELLKWDFKSIIKLACLLVLGLNGSPMSKERKNI